MSLVNEVNVPLGMLSEVTLANCVLMPQGCCSVMFGQISFRVETT